MTEKKYAVLIGNGAFEKKSLLQPLRCSVKDATDFNEVLRSKIYGLFDDSLVLTDKPSHEVLQEMNRFLNQAEKEDLVLIYYSGHGKVNDKGTLHLATRETQVELLGTTSISVVRIQEAMDECRSKKMILILDCCYSGRVAGAFSKGEVDDQLKLVAGGNSGHGVYLLTASTGVQVAQEKEGDENSLLTKYLLKGIREAKADFDDDGFVTISDLYKYASANIKPQVPTRTDINIQGDSLRIARTGHGPGEKRQAEQEQLLYYRHLLHDRSIIGGLTIGGALGGGIAVLLVRLLVSLAVGPDLYSLPALFFNVIVASVLSGAMSLGMALAAQLWQTSTGNREQNILLRWASYFRNRSNFALLFGTVAFALTYFFFAFINNPNQPLKAATTIGIFGTLGGLGLGLAAYGLPTTSARLSVRSWLMRIATTGIIYALLALPAALGKMEIIPNLTWDKGAFASAFVQSPWLQNRTMPSNNVLMYFAIADAFIVGCAIAIGTTFGLTKAANVLGEWVKNVQPERE